MKFLLPFIDDTTLIFAVTMRNLLIKRGHDVVLGILEDERGDLSKRQISMFMNGDGYETIDSLPEHLETRQYDSLITAKAPRSVRTMLAKPSYRQRSSRPCFIAFQPGLEFTPERGFKNRQHFDAVFLNNTQHADLFLEQQKQSGWQHVSFGHPYFRVPEQPASVPDGGDIVFFTQAICPPSLKGRLHILDMLTAMADAYPERKVVLKLRHLPGENTNHAHKEKYPYPELLESFFPNPPANLELVSGTMKEALERASYCITCTSTAAMDAISKGIPTAVYTDYVERHLDPYIPAMNKEFEMSGIITPLEDILRLQFRHPTPRWMADHFRGDDLIEELEAVVAAFPTKENTDELRPKNA